MRSAGAGHGRLRSAAACFVTGVTVIAGILLPNLAALPPASASPTDSGAVIITVDGINPSTPQRSYKKQPLEIRLTLTNRTAQTLKKVSILAERGDPITTQAALDQVVADPMPPADGGVSIPSSPKTTATIPAGSSVHVSFDTTTDIPRDAGICLCHNAVYPLFLSAHTTSTNGSDTELGSAPTFLPVFYKSPPRLRVGWIWPILEPPHRLSSDTLFIDDGLAASVASGGRLDHLLSVLEETDPSTPLTVLLDPETIDELQVMTGPYRVQSGTGSVAGTEHSVAADWLARLRDALSDHPNYRIELTPYADPDVESLSERGYGWKTTLPADMAKRVSTALGGAVTHRDLAWPVAPRLSNQALKSLAQSGVSSVVLDSSAVNSPSTPAQPVPEAARLASGHGKVAGVIVNPTLADRVSRTVSADGDGAAALPILMSELAIQVTTDLSTSHAVVLTPPRDVDPSVSDAVAAIDTTTASPFTSAISVPGAVTGRFLSRRASTLRAPTDGSSGLSPSTLDAVGDVRRSVATLTSLLACSKPPTASCTAVTALLAALPTTVQRSESSAWRQDVSGADNAGDSSARSLASLVHKLSTGVRIAPPSGGAYTLGSSNAPIPITIVNDLDYPANVTVRVTTVGGLPGFSTSDIGAKILPAHRITTIQLPAKVQRSGGFRVQVALTTPSGAELGPPVILTLHSTALGRVGVIITITAGALLLLALIYRAARGLGRRRRRQVARTGSAS